ncbi:hypothetical protein AAP_02546 [Ascosphaera apis ARSEF 7405]|uniref:Retrotransposon gag domain-containing protein n=1 Tax=Ascosphaera apis ARSEF 7405 TaxID=392613 RepID=A0A166NXQ8_9EURO|nr:hypothetical protein AAP_02546 [Ascosphaera apis ARSEF 7405]
MPAISPRSFQPAGYPPDWDVDRSTLNMATRKLHESWIPPLKCSAHFLRWQSIRVPPLHVYAAIPPRPLGFNRKEPPRSTRIEPPHSATRLAIAQRRKVQPTTETLVDFSEAPISSMQIPTVLDSDTGITRHSLPNSESIESQQAENYLIHQLHQNKASSNHRLLTTHKPNHNLNNLAKTIHSSETTESFHPRPERAPKADPILEPTSTIDCPFASPRTPSSHTEIQRYTVEYPSSPPQIQSESALQSLHYSDLTLADMSDNPNTESATQATNSSRPSSRVGFTRAQREELNQILQSAIQQMRTDNMPTQAAPPQVTNLVEPDMPEPVQQRSIWKAEELGFFDPGLKVEDSMKSGAVSYVGHHFYFTNVHDFISRARDFIAAKGEQMVRLNLVSCLRGTALEWYSTELTELERAGLRATICDHGWFPTLEKRFRMKFSPAWTSIKNSRYTLKDAADGRSIREYVQNLIKTCNYAGISDRSTQIDLAFASLHPELQAQVPYPDAGTTLQTFLVNLENRAQSWGPFARMRLGRFSQYPNNARNQTTAQAQPHRNGPSFRGRQDYRGRGYERNRFNRHSYSQHDPASDSNYQQRTLPAPSTVTAGVVMTDSNSNTNETTEVQQEPLQIEYPQETPMNDIIDYEDAIEEDF